MTQVCEFENMESDQASLPEYQELIEYMNSLPAALRPVYTTEQPNQPIVLYEGDLKIVQEINQLQGHGKVEYVWFPYPHIKFEFSTQSASCLVHSCWINHNRIMSLTLCDIQASVDVFIKTMSTGGSQEDNLSGRTQKPIAQGTGQDLAYVLFHVVNFHDFIGGSRSVLTNDSGSRFLERVVLEEEEWKLTLEQLETTQDTVKLLNAQGGFVITHVGKLEKSNGQTFSDDKAIEVLDTFANFLSFARGFKVPLMLFVGYDAEEKQIWQHWNSSGGHSWKYVNSWFPTNNAEILAEIFPSFLSCWEEWKEKESEKLALYNYLEANVMPTLEVKIVLTQIALELIANIESQNRGNASEKLRGLFGKYNIPVNIPFDQPSQKTSTLTDAFKPQSPPLVENLIRLKEKLKQELEEKLENETNKKEKHKIEKELRQIDAPYLFTTVRNDIVHSKKKIENLRDYLYEASDLGLWYLELVLLAIFNYRGCYSNRLPRQNGQTEPVPWS
jgi:hypothetical protein